MFDITVKSLYDTIVDGVTPYTKKTWRAVAIELEISQDEIEEIDSDINIRNIGVREIGLRVLQSWFDNSDEDEATVEKLIKVLEDQKLKKSANKLRAKFQRTTDNSSGSGEGPQSVKPEEDDYEKRLNKFIKDNLPGLQSKTILHSKVLAILFANDVIGDADQNMLDAIPNKSEKNLKFYQEILANRNGYFPILLKAMQDTKQSGVVTILKKFQE